LQINHSCVRLITLSREFASVKMVFFNWSTSVFPKQFTCFVYITTYYIYICIIQKT